MNLTMKWVIIEEKIAVVIVFGKIRATGGVMYPFAVNMIMGNDIQMDFIVVMTMIIAAIIRKRKMFAILCKPSQYFLI